MTGIVHEPLLIFFSLSSVDDEHDVGNSHACLSDVRRQDNLEERKAEHSSWDFQDLYIRSVRLTEFNPNYIILMQKQTPYDLIVPHSEVPFSLQQGAV